MHMIGGGQSTEYFIQHYTEHTDRILHHHDDEAGSSGSHEDDTDQSLRHLADVDHGFSMNVLLPVPPAVISLPEVRAAPMVRPDAFFDRTTIPPLRPPRTPV
jgi:hypothetical protein